MTAGIGATYQMIVIAVSSAPSRNKKILMVYLPEICFIVSIYNFSNVVQLRTLIELTKKYIRVEERRIARRTNFGQTDYFDFNTHFFFFYILPQLLVFYVATILIE